MNLCCDAFNILRKENVRLVNIFGMMTSAGMPELQEDKNIDYMVKALALELDNHQAAALFQKEIKAALNTWSRRFDNFIHNVKAKYV